MADTLKCGIRSMALFSDLVEAVYDGADKISEGQASIFMAERLEYAARTVREKAELALQRIKREKANVS